MARRSPGEPGTYALVAGGGTAGHVLPGLAVARALVLRGHDPATIHFVGSERGLEASLVPAAGFGLTVLPGRGIQRRLTLENVAAVWGLLKAVVKGVGLVRRRRPDVVLVLGGYASVACVIGAVLWRVPDRGGRAERPGRGGEPAGGVLRQGLGRAVPRDRSSPEGRHRQPGAGRGAGHRPRRRPCRGARGPRSAARPHGRRRGHGFLGRPQGQPGGAGGGSGRGPTATISPSATSSARATSTR